MKRTVEFWCSTNGGGCGGYFTVRLRTNIDGNYTMVCPKCKHKHNRNIRKGEITNSRCNELDRRKDDDREVIIVPRSAFTEDSVFKDEDIKPPMGYGSDYECSRIVKDDAKDKKIIKTSLWGRFMGRNQ
jgi:hypothetical protein